LLSPFARTLLRTPLMKLTLPSLALALTLALTPNSNAGPRRYYAQPAYQPAYQPAFYQYPAYQPIYRPAFAAYQPAGVVVANYAPAAPVVSAGYSGGAGDGLDEVNAKRAARGLRPFIRDAGLTQAASACAAFRAERGLFGHTSNDFAFLPPGATAASTGCAAYPASYGWMSCCVYEGYAFAGAAWVTGRDGRRYMHLLVR
jgi:hypothetical protein